MKKRNCLKQAGDKKKKWFAPFKLLFFSFFATLSVFLTLLLITSAYSDFISPEKNVLFAYAGLLFPVLLAVNLLFLVYWIIVKKWILVFTMVAALAVCWKPVTLFFPFHPVKKEISQEEHIKVLSYNVMSFAYKGHTEEVPNKIIQYIAESDADIVCLQEYMVSARPNLMSSQDVAAALPMYPYRSEIFFTPPGNRNYQYGLALLSKFPIIASRRIPFSSSYNGAAIYEINVREKRVTVVNNHLESFKLTAEDRSKYSDMITHVNFESFDEFRNAMQQKLGQAFRTRAKQAETIAAEIQKANGYYTIVCGDFNDTPISYAHRTIQGTLLDAYAESGLGMGISYNQNFFFFRIDHIFHSFSLEACNCRVDPRVKLSDHYPVFCYMKIN